MLSLTLTRPDYAFHGLVLLGIFCILTGEAIFKSKQNSLSSRGLKTKSMHLYFEVATGWKKVDFAVLRYKNIKIFPLF